MKNQQLDQSLLRTAFTDERFLQLIRKYATVLIILIVIEAIMHRMISFLPLLPIYGDMSSISYASYIASVIFFTTIVANVAVALVVLTDMRKTENISWPIILLTLVFKEAGVVFFLLLYVNNRCRQLGQ